MASEIAVVSGTPRIARLATASSHRTSVRTVEAAKTIAYCWRNLVFVKSTLAVPFTASLSFPTIHAAASAQPRAREERGSRELSTVEGALVLGAASPSSQYCFAGPISRSQALLPGLGLGEGSAKARAGKRTTAV